MADKKSTWDEGISDRLAEIQKTEGRAASAPILQQSKTGLSFIPFDQAPRNKAGVVIYYDSQKKEYRAHSGFGHCASCTWRPGTDCNCLARSVTEAYWMPLTKS